MKMKRGCRSPSDPGRVLLLPTMMLPGSEPEPALTAVTLGSQMIRVPARDLKRKSLSERPQTCHGSLSST